ncbi:MAG: glutamate formimidoyltransferase [Anaerolineae bacterium]|nr:glutamate formimidoyltransferase [Anaerolineae bacterium]
MKPLIECVPNFSEGRRLDIVEKIVSAVRGVPGIALLDYSSDPDHNRSVLTFVGAPGAVEEAAFRAVETSAGLIDMTRHEGVHPCIGAADVVPFVPIRDVTMGECVAAARRLARRIGEDLNIPAYLYEEAAIRLERANLAHLRKGGYARLKADIATDPERAPDFGPAVLGPAGAAAVGARKKLIAYNVFLDTDDVEIARKIAESIRHSSGGLPYVKALGLMVNGQAQVSMNLVDYTQTPVHRVQEAVREQAGHFGCQITHAELIGMIPEQALIDAACWYLQLGGFNEEQILERRIRQAESTGLI